MFLDVCSALESIDSYVQDNRDSDKEKSLKKLGKVLERIDEWGDNDLKIFRTLVAPSINEFKEVFAKKL